MSLEKQLPQFEALDAIQDSDLICGYQSDLGHWTASQFKTYSQEAAPVQSVAGKTGAVTLTESDIANLTTDLAAKLDKSGGMMTGDLILNADATDPLQPVTFQQFGNAIAHISAKSPCYAATTANFDAAYNNGSTGVGATLTANSNGVFSTDSVTPPLFSRIFVQNQTDGIQNGIYELTNVGSASTKAVLTRAPDYDNSTSGEVSVGSYTFIENGATYGGTCFYLTTTGPIIIGIIPLTFAQILFPVVQSPLTHPFPNQIALNQTLLSITASQISNATSAGNALLTAANAAAQRTALALGALATKSTINNGDWSGTQQSIANGGTNATSMTTSNGVVKYDGTKLATSTTFKIDSSNRVTNTSQPAFLAYNSTVRSNVTGAGVTYTVAFNSVVKDQNSNFSSTTTFTASVTGMHVLMCNVLITGLSASNTSYVISIVTSNGVYEIAVGNPGNFKDVSNNISDGGAVFADMDIGDTAIVTVTVYGGSQVVGVGAVNRDTFFSGYLVC